MGVPVVLWAVVGSAAVVSGAPARRPWEDAALPVEARVAALLPLLSVEELVAQVRAVNTYTAAALISEFNATSLGVSWIMGDAGIAEVNRAVVANSRWKIPISFYHESLHGGCFGCTIFPMPVMLGSTFNADLVRAVYDAVGNETAASGAQLGFAPVINMFEDPRFGRFHEGFSADPSMTAIFAKAAVEGFQGPAAARHGGGYYPKGRVATLAKHFVGYGGAAGGQNCGPLRASEREVRDFYMAPWRAYVKHGGLGVMPSHQTVLEVPMHANKQMMTDVLRGELGFGPGLAVSDCDDIATLVGYRVATSPADAAAKALNAGVDVDLQCVSATYTLENVEAALQQNLTTLAALRTAAGRVLHFKFATGLFDNPYAPGTPGRVLDPPEFRRLAKKAADEGIVLLKNAGGALPLPVTALGGIKLLGFMASTLANQSYAGPYTSFGAPITTVQKALKDRGLAVPYAVGAAPDAPADPKEIDAAVELAYGDGKASAVVVVLGDSMKSCGEWLDRSSLDLPGGQAALLDALIARRPAAGAPPLILVLMTGRPTTFGPRNAQLAGVDAALWAGRPGEEGGASIVDVLSGAVNPSGKLQASWVKAVGHVGSGAAPLQHQVVGKWSFYAGRTDPSVTKPDPDGRVYANYWNDPAGDAAPLFPFGYGLSYTTFRYADIAASYAPSAAVLTVTFSLTNTGGVEGAEAAQLYVVTPAGSVVARPWKRLAAFGKTVLAPGETQQVTLTAGADELALSGEADVKARVVASGEWQARVGGSSRTDVLVASFVVPS